VLKHELDAVRPSGPVDLVPIPAGGEVWPTQDLITTAETIGAIAAGVALFEAALIPGVVIGGAVVLAPNYLPALRRRLRPLVNATANWRLTTAAPMRKTSPAGFAFKRALAKTITFRIIVTSLDFTSNYIVIGEAATAAGLSAFALVVGPLFYLIHEAAWNSLGTSVSREPGRWGPAVDLPVPLPPWPGAKAKRAGRSRLTINRALAKTITFRTVATTMDFTANYVVVGELGTAVVLSAFGFVVGPFVYLGHEMVWDYYGPPAHDHK